MVYLLVFAAMKYTMVSYIELVLGNTPVFLLSNEKEQQEQNNTTAYKKPVQRNDRDSTRHFHGHQLLNRSEVTPV